MTDDLHLTPSERELIRREFMARFSPAPSVTQGFVVKRWATGPQKGCPKLSAAVQGMLERGLITLVDEGHWPRVQFTAKGFQALKLMAKEPRAFNHDHHRELIDELALLTNV